MEVSVVGLISFRELELGLGRVPLATGHLLKEFM